MDALCQVWMKLVQWFWRRRLLNCIFTISLFPLGKGMVLHLNKLKSPLLKDALWQVWLKLAQWFWRRKMKMWKVYRQTDRWRTTGYLKKLTRVKKICNMENLKVQKKLTKFIRMMQVHFEKNKCIYSVKWKTWQQVIWNTHPSQKNLKYEKLQLKLKS